MICVLNEKGTLRYSGIRKEMMNITDAVLSTTLKELITDNICMWAGIFHKSERENIMTQCQRCDYHQVSVISQNSRIRDL